MNWNRRVHYAVVASALMGLTSVEGEFVSLTIDPTSQAAVTVKVSVSGQLAGQFTQTARFSGNLDFNVSRSPSSAIETFQLLPSTKMFAAGLENVTLDLGFLGQTRWSMDRIAFTFASTVFPPYFPDSPLLATLQSFDGMTGTSIHRSDLSDQLMPAYQGYLAIGPGTGAIDSIMRLFDPDGVFEFFEFDSAGSFPSEIIINDGGGELLVTSRPSGVRSATINLNTTDFDLIPLLEPFELELTIAGTIRTVTVPELSSTTTLMVAAGVFLMVTRARRTNP